MRRIHTHKTHVFITLYHLFTWCLHTAHSTVNCNRSKLLKCRTKICTTNKNEMPLWIMTDAFFVDVCTKDEESEKSHKIQWETRRFHYLFLFFICLSGFLFFFVFLSFYIDCVYSLRALCVAWSMYNFYFFTSCLKTAMFSLFYSHRLFSKGIEIVEKTMASKSIRIMHL